MRTLNTDVFVWLAPEGNEPLILPVCAVWVSFWGNNLNQMGDQFLQSDLFQVSRLLNMLLKIKCLLKPSWAQRRRENYISQPILLRWACTVSRALRKWFVCRFPDLRIRRQHSSESMSSINSAASHSSMGSLGKDAEDKKKKKKSWVGGEKKRSTEVETWLCGKRVFCGLYSAPGEKGSSYGKKKNI